MSEIDYLYIDGGYLRGRFETGIREMFDAEPEIDFDSIRRTFDARRVFYYDCLDDVRRGGESEGDLKARVKIQNEYFSRILSVDGYHIRLGTLSGASAKKMRQKEVDVQLAVDMLTDAFYKNMNRATLISGDLDFRPVLESLIRLGTYVRLAYDPRSIAADLIAAADMRHPIDYRTLHLWSTRSFQMKRPIPQAVGFGSLPDGPIINEGTLDGRPVQLMKTPDGYTVIIRNYRGSDLFGWSFPGGSLQFLLEKFLPLMDGEIQWSTPPNTAHD